MEWSPLTRALIALAAAERGEPLSEDEWLHVEIVVESYFGPGGELGPDWILELVRSLGAATLSESLVDVPSPGDDGSLSSIFLECGDVIPELLWDDYGEGISHVFERIGVRFFLSREGNPGFYSIRPYGPPEESRTWHLAQYAKRWASD
ncbi:MAG TPA: hypothetical protein DEF51_10530 [Myxococcales bacterium]|nr:hypothetical protein [Myxococcales bacterium]